MHDLMQVYTYKREELASGALHNCSGVIMCWLAVAPAGRRRPAGQPHTGVLLLNACMGMAARTCTGQQRRSKSNPCISSSHPAALIHAQCKVHNSTCTPLFELKAAKVPDLAAACMHTPGHGARAAEQSMHACAPRKKKLA